VAESLQEERVLRQEQNRALLAAIGEFKASSRDSASELAGALDALATRFGDLRDRVGDLRDGWATIRGVLLGKGCPDCTCKPAPCAPTIVLPETKPAPVPAAPATAPQPSRPLPRKGAAPWER
jgi:hypothetical protein